MKKERRKMKKLIIALLVVLTLVGCGTSRPTDENKLVVSCTLDPHSRVLEFVKPILKEKYGIELEIIVLDDYYIFNKALDAGEVDANYFQHVPFFKSEVAANGYDIENALGVHIEPFGFYSTTIKDIKDLPDGAEIVISNAVADHGRLLKILENNGVLTLKAGVDTLEATLADIAANPKNLVFKEIKPELLISAYESKEGDLVAINGNYALQGGLSPAKDAVILETGGADNPYVNIIAIKTGTGDKAKIKALLEVMASQEVKDFIKSTWSDGSVIAAE